MPSPLMQLPQYIDSTMLTCARSCLEKFRIEFGLGLRPPGISIDLHAGACFASATEAYRKAIFVRHCNEDEAAQLADAAFSVAWGDYQIPDYKKTAKTHDNMLRAVHEYFKRFPARTDHIQPYFFESHPTFEFTFALPLEPCAPPDLTGGNNFSRYVSYNPDDHDGHFPLHPSGDPWLYSGRFDMFGAYQGLPCIEDDKTTGRSISSGWADQWNLRNQFLGYVWACQQSGISLNTVVIRGIAIQVREIKFEEAIKVYPDHLIRRWHEQLRRDLWRIRHAHDAKYFDYNLGDACTNYGNCTFMNVCSATEEQKDNWYNDFEVRRWNPLHKNPIDGEPKP